DIMREVDSRIDQINDSKDGIIATEQRLQKLYTDGEKQLELLHAVASKGASVKKSKAGSNFISPQVRSNVISLKAQGWTNAEIAKSLNLEENAVQLILEVGTDE
ncbi:MAG: hypothetical protein Q4B64_05160, partial [Spirochaetales bacterium]|nr:hypothetical protein [Spirochaetales bacterium]